MTGKARVGEIDLIIVKFISRFTRNTVTVLEVVRELRNLGAGIFFEKKDFYTQEMPINAVFTALSKGTWCLVGV